MKDHVTSQSFCYYYITSGILQISITVVILLTRSKAPSKIVGVIELDTLHKYTHYTVYVEKEYHFIWVTTYLLKALKCGDINFHYIIGLQWYQHEVLFGNRVIGNKLNYYSSFRAACINHFYRSCRTNFVSSVVSQSFIKQFKYATF